MPSVSRRQDFIGQVAAPNEPGIYELRIQIRPEEDPRPVFETDKITFRVPAS